jgi:hypothetical protein
MPTRTRTYHPQAGPSALGTPEVASRGNGNQPSGLLLGRPCAEGTAGWRNDRPEGRGQDEGLLIVLFTDVEGSTELSTGRGDAAARDLLRVHEELVRALRSPPTKAGSWEGGGTASW